MSTTDGRVDESGQLERLPEFDLSYLLDDGERPGAVTVYDPDAPDSRWMSAAIAGATSLDEVR